MGIYGILKSPVPHDGISSKGADVPRRESKEMVTQDFNITILRT